MISKYLLRDTMEGWIQKEYQYIVPEHRYYNEELNQQKLKDQEKNLSNLGSQPNPSTD